VLWVADSGVRGRHGDPGVTSMRMVSLVMGPCAVDRTDFCQVTVSSYPAFVSRVVIKSHVYSAVCLFLK
jgi:hypothetical protein